jgi:D-glycero-D-manno-heptose 1,7-bisphosphate phosphatase
MGSDPRPAVFLDRDGTLLEECDYLDDPGRVRFLPGALAALRRLRDAGYLLVVVTNQSGIARGLYSEAAYHEVQARVDVLLARAGTPVDATYYCPHHPDFTGPCDCRKPGPGMYRAAERDLGLALERSWFVGDKVTDVLPALALGGRGVLVRTGYGTREAAGKPPGVELADDLAGAAERILAAGKR